VLVLLGLAVVSVLVVALPVIGTAWRNRLVLFASRSATPPPAGVAATAATRVTAAAVIGAIVLAGLGILADRSLLSLVYSDAPNPGDHGSRQAWVGGLLPAGLVIAALLVARARHWCRITYWLAVISPVLPLLLWWLGRPFWNTFH
jgi:hypothetical protein